MRLLKAVEAHGDDDAVAIAKNPDHLDLSFLVESHGDDDAVAIGQLYRKARGAAIESIRYAIQCGRALKLKKASLAHGAWLPWLEDNVDALGFESRQTASRLMKLAANGALAQHLDASQAAAVLKQLWGHESVHFSSASAEWHTPDSIIQRVLSVLGSIELDPCADSKQSVPAATHYTELDDGLSKRWSGRVFLNPPYGDVIAEWVDKLRSEFLSGRVTEAVALVPARVDTEWFAMLREFPVCFVHRRLKFGGHENSAPFPSAVVYLGKAVAKFAKEFGKIGDVWVLWRQQLYGRDAARSLVRP